MAWGGALAGDIFISYRRSDQAKAELLHRLLAERGVDAWYDALLKAGEDWRTKTAQALVDAPVFVLLFSKNAAQSDDIIKELSAATFQKKTVIPVRIEDIHPEGAFLYELASRNWFDAFNNTEARLAVLADQLAGLVHGGAEARAAAAKLGAAVPLPRMKEKRRGWVPVSIAAIVASAVVAIVWSGMNSPDGDGPASRNAFERVAFFGFKATDDDATANSMAGSATDEGFRVLRELKLDVAPRDDTADAQDVVRLERAKELDARFALSGVVRHKGDQVEATIRLEDVRSRAALWEQTLSAPASAPLPAALGAAVAGAKVVRCMTSNEFAEAAKVSTADVPLLADACGWTAYAPLLQTLRELAKRMPDDPIVQSRIVLVLMRQYDEATPATRATLLVDAKSAVAQAQAEAPEGYAVASALAQVAMTEGRPPAEWIGMAELALQRTPDIDESYHYGRLNVVMAQAMAMVGRLKDANRYGAAAYGSYPVEEYNGYTYALVNTVSGEPVIERLFEKLLERDPNDWGWELGVASAILMKRSNVNALMAMAPVTVGADGEQCYRDLQAAVAKGPGNVRRDEVKKIDACLLAFDSWHMNTVAMAALGDVDRAVELLSEPDFVRLSNVDYWPTLFWPAARPLRADPRFMPLMEKYGLVDYWKTTNTQPDVCATAEERGIPLCIALREAK